jgi:hypothetical protein
MTYNLYKPYRSSEFAFHLHSSLLSIPLSNYN